MAAPAAGARKPAAAPEKARESGQRAIVHTDNAMVFGGPDMESEPIRYLPKNKPVIISKKQYGDASLPFYKVKLDGGRVGYVAVIDVAPEGGDPNAKPGDGGKKKGAHKARPKKNEDEPEDENGKTPFFATRYVGASLAQIDFADGIGGNEYSEGLTFFGLRFDGPGLPFGTPSEMNFMLHSGAPSYYDRYSTGGATGFAAHSDFLLMFPLGGGDATLIYLLAGPALTYYSWDVPTASGGTKNLSQLSIGLSLGLGGAVRIGKFAVRVDYKYVIEDRTHKGFVFSLQREF